MATKRELVDQAEALGIDGVARLNKDALERAIRNAVRRARQTAKSSRRSHDPGAPY